MTHHPHPAELQHDRANGHSKPRLPVAPAPARVGTAGISAGEEYLYKDHITNAPDPRWRETTPHAFARVIGWSSLALGVAQIVAAHPVARCLGVEKHVGIVRACGARQIVNGAGLLIDRRSSSRARWMQARAVGDATDVGLLCAVACAGENRKRANAAAALTAAGAVLALDLFVTALLSDG